MVHVESDTVLHVESKLQEDFTNIGDALVFHHLDHRDMYKSVNNLLNRGGCLGIFPEGCIYCRIFFKKIRILKTKKTWTGGSHDRTELLPLKPGVAIMALNAMSKNSKLDVKIGII